MTYEPEGTLAAVQGEYLGTAKAVHKRCDAVKLAPSVRVIAGQLDFLDEERFPCFGASRASRRNPVGGRFMPGTQLTWR